VGLEWIGKMLNLARVARQRLALAWRGGRMGRRCAIAPQVRLECRRGRPIVLGDGVRLQRGVVLSTRPGGRITLESRVYVGEYGIVRSAAEIRIARDTIIAPHASIVDFDPPPGAPPPDALAVQSAIRPASPNGGYAEASNPPFDHAQGPEALEGQSAIEAAPIRIGRDVWFGAGVTVRPGVQVGDQAVLGAGTVADRDIPDRGVAVGIPARIVRFRGASPEKGKSPA
jgi:acetyltransferase-like isoleucine patch superfamily enzyme